MSVKIYRDKITNKDATDGAQNITLDKVHQNTQKSIYENPHKIERELVGVIANYDTNPNKATFRYNNTFLRSAQANSETGISHLLPLDSKIFTNKELSPFFQGLLPEGEVINKLSILYQIPQSNYLGILEKLGCESIGALTFVSSVANPENYSPHYTPLTARMIDDMRSNPAYVATKTASETRLSLAGAQSKIAWFLPKDKDTLCAKLGDWCIPKGTAPSTHIIKIARPNEEYIAQNEYACSLIANSCGIETAKVTPLKEISGTIAVERYDRIWVNTGIIDGSACHTNFSLARLHQEDFCQALGFPTYLKYQPPGVEANYPYMMVDLLTETSENPQTDVRELVLRILFCYAIGNSDAHLKNFSLLYNSEWTARRLAPMYDITCIPLTGYSTQMPFDIGEHRKLEEINEHDIVLLANDMGMALSVFEDAAEELVTCFEALCVERVMDGALNNANEATVDAIEQILDNAKPRIQVLKKFIMGR